jgi:branched-subunit amino acid aminotransferase/4-amino-4-deoxychorismate lyase
VWTAGISEGVVWGTARARVLEACRRLGYALREEAPAAAARHTWREAFLTNSLRLVQPLRRISCGAANVWGLPPWELELSTVPGPVTVTLAAALAAVLPACPVAEL